jgi:eukaryotic-like serine/threonine-protein kinase
MPKTCPCCASPVPDRAAYCPACGLQLPAAASRALAASPARARRDGDTAPAAGSAFELQAKHAASRSRAAAATATETPIPPQAVGPRDETALGWPAWSHPDLTGVTAAPGPAQGASPAGSRPRASEDEPADRRPVGPLSVGQQFGRYTIIRLLGIGGMGAVYQAWDETLEVPVALKVILPEAVATESAAEDLERRFKRELLLARQVTHRNVVRIHDLGELEGIKYITMSFVNGVDLATMLASQGRLPVPEALRILRGVVAGLIAAHDAGVVHRDLKPANIMVESATGEPLIMDFGIARSSSAPVAGESASAGSLDGGHPFSTPSALTHATMAGAIVGTVAYMAPEQARGRAVDQRADLYALGLIAYDMLVGRRRLEGSGPVEELQRRLVKAPPAPRSLDPEIPEALDQVVVRCLQPEPDGRFTTARDLAAALAALDEAGNPLPALRRLTGRFFGIAAAAMVAVAASTYLLARPAPPAPTPAPVSVLVADFVDRTRDPLFKETLESALATGMEGASFITSYPRQTAQRLAAQISPGSGLTAEVARLVSAREGIKVVLAGSIDPTVSGYEVHVRAIDPGVNKELAVASAIARSKDGLLGAIGTVAARLRGALGDTTPESVRLAAMETVTAGNLAALEAYQRGQDLARNNKPEEALAAYEQAIRLDPGMGRAYAGMGVVYNDLKDEAKTEAAYGQALKHVDRMTEREKYRTLGTYYLLVARNYEKAIENYQMLLKLYPADSAGHGNLGMAYMLTGNPKRAVAEAREVLKIYPKNLKQRFNLTLYLMYSGEFDEAISRGSEIVQESPSYAIGYLPIALSTLSRRDVTGALDVYRRLEESGPVGVRLARLGRADLAMYRGRYREAQQLVAPALAPAAESDNASLAQDLIVSAQAALALGRKEAAVAAARKAAALSSHESVLFPAALALVDAGAPEEAARIATTLENMLQVHTTAYARLVEAQIAVREERYAAAVEAFRDSIKRRDTWFARFLLGRTYARAEHFAEAMAELELALGRRGEVTDVFMFDTPTLRYLPEVYYWLARSQQAMGAANARKTYEEYLALRDQADPPDPLVADVRKRLAF